jgi:Fe(3+) dicitrate transport protein
MKFFMIFLLLLPYAFAQNELAPIEVIDHQDFAWQETDEVKILSGKKNTKTKIKDLPPIQTDNLRQFFAQQPSIHTPEQTTEPWTIMNYRGIGSPQEGQNILILQDDLPTSMDMYGQADNYFAPPAPLMEEIQVIAGGGGLLFGPQVGGVVNYISPTLKEKQDFSGRANFAVGSYNLKSTVNQIKGSSKRTAYSVGYYRKQGDGYQRQNADFNADHVQLKSSTFLENQTIFKSAFQGFNADYGMPGGMALDKASGLNTWGKDNRKATRKYNRLRLSRALIMFGLEKKLNERTAIDSQVWASAYRKYNKTQRGSGFGKIPIGTNNSINTSQAYGLNALLRFKHDYDSHTLTGGYLTYNTQAPSVDETGLSPDANHGDVTSRVYSKTRAQALFAENRFVFNRWQLVPGVRLENMSLSSRQKDIANDTNSQRSDSYNVALFGFGASYDLSDKAQFYFNASQGFKPVSYEQVIGQGNPNFTVEGDIKPSYNYFYESGVRTETSQWRGDATLYLIHRQNILATNNNVLTNGSSARYYGLDISATLKDVTNSKSKNSLDLYANANLMNARYMRGDFEGKTPGHAPSALVKYGIIYRDEAHWHVSLMSTFVNEHYSDDAHTDDYFVPSYTLFDLLAEYQLSDSMSLNAAINNLLDLEYYGRVMPTGVMPTMGRNAYAGMTFRF